MTHYSIIKKLLARTGFTALTLLGLVSGAAHAQSVDFHRGYVQGYDEGYRDGLASRSHSDRAEGVGRIIIEEARYGTQEDGGRFCNATDAIKRAINGNPQLEITASNDLCGDPAPRKVKILKVRYRCGDAPRPERVEVAETGVLRIACQ